MKNFARLDPYISASLLLIWTLLVIFGIISLIQPPWLEELSDSGRAVEAQTNIDHGNNLMYDKQFSEAIHAYKESLKIDSSNATAIGNMAVAYANLGDFPKAYETFMILQKMDTSSRYLAFTNIADLYEKREMTDSAAFYYRGAIANNPNPSYTLRKAGWYTWLNGQAEEGKSLLKLAIDTQSSVHTFFAEAIIGEFHSIANEEGKKYLPAADSLLKLNKGDFLEKRFCTDLFRKMIYTDESNGFAHYYLGNIYFMEGDSVLAEENYKKSIRFSPNFIGRSNDFKNRQSKTILSQFRSKI